MNLLKQTEAQFSIQNRYSGFYRLMLILAFLQSNVLYCQLNNGLFVETGTAISKNDRLPFWLFSNNYNTISTDRFNAWFRAGYLKHDSVGQNWTYGYGLDLIERYSVRNKVYFEQAYASVAYRSITLKGGLWEDRMGNHNHTLGTGGFLWSGNARPIPRIGIYIIEYKNVPFTKGLVKFKGGVYHGWFGNSNIYKRALLHHKYIYIQTTLHQHFALEYGLHHFAQWGGTSIDLGEMPDDIRTFARVFLARGGGSGALTNEIINAVGNHLGSHNFSITRYGKNIDSRFYWQSIFEDGSGMRLKNIKDGLFGLNFSIKQFKPASEFVIEFVNTTNQSGSKGQHLIDGTWVTGTGNDNYFNNGIYLSGWTYRRMTIGTPLITSPALLSDETGSRIVNNRIKALHTGISGKIGIMDYLLLYTFSKNYATYLHPFASVKNQHSFMLKASFDELLPWSIKTTVALAVDAGDLLGNHTGFLISLKKEGVLSKKQR